MRVRVRAERASPQQVNVDRPSLSRLPLSLWQSGRLWERQRCQGNRNKIAKSIQIKCPSRARADAETP